MDVLGTAASAVFTSPLAGGEHGCARCGRRTATLTPTGQVVSAKFTGYSDWVGPPTSGVCRDCAWALHTKDLRRHPLLVRHTPPSVAQASREDLATLLAGPLPVEVSVTVPLRPGRKHLLPSAQWGHVTTDDATLRWGPGDAARLHAIQRLRRCGFGGRMLSAPAPAWPVLRRLGPRARAEAVTDWARLDPWRAAVPWMRLGLHVTVPSSPARRAA